MGILRNKNHYEPIRIEDVALDDATNDYANYLFDSDFTDEENNEEEYTPAQRVNSYRRKKPKNFRRKYAVEIVDGLQIKQNMGAQKWRRVENAKVIMSFADMQDICFDGSDLIPETITAFTRLLRDEANMKAWNEFIEKDEAEQARLLRQIERDLAYNRKNVFESKACTSKLIKGNKEVPCKLPTPESCFERLDKKFKKSLLSRRHLQYDYMEKTEKTLRDFFQEFRAGVYLEQIGCRIKRFYMHAIAQFLLLKSKTIIDEETKKIVEVWNEKELFRPPEMLLASFLKNRRRTMKRGHKVVDEWDEECDI